MKEKEQNNLQREKNGRVGVKINERVLASAAHILKLERYRD